MWSQLLLLRLGLYEHSGVYHLRQILIQGIIEYAEEAHARKQYTVAYATILMQVQP